MTLTVPVERLTVPEKLQSSTRLCVRVCYEAGAECDSLVNKSCQMSLS